MSDRERIDDNPELKKAQDTFFKTLPKMTPKIAAAIYEKSNKKTINKKGGE